MNRTHLLMASFIALLHATTTFAGDPYDYAGRWQSWTIEAREAYLDGVVDGIAEAYIYTMTTVAEDKLSLQPEPNEVAKAREHLFVRDTRSRLCGVITDLYNDPANGFIGNLEMYFIAKDKIEGKDVSESIMKARKNAMDVHMLNDNLKER